MATKQDRATQDFLLGLKAVRDVPAQQATRILRGSASLVGEALVVGNEFGPGTPVDTGFARGSWYATSGDSEERTTPAPARAARETADGSEGHTLSPVASPDALTQQGLGNLMLGAATVNLGDGLGFVNDAEYIVPLNDGHSAQAPVGITDSVVSAWDTIVERETAKVLGGASDVDPWHTGAGGES